MGGLTHPGQVFVERLFRGVPGKVLLLAMLPEKGAKRRHVTRIYDDIDVALGRLEGEMGFLRSANRSGYGIYVRISSQLERPADGKVGKETNCRVLPALFVDLDNAPLPELLERLKTVPKPSILVQTSPDALHCYWLLERPIDITKHDDWKHSKVRSRIWPGLCDHLTKNGVRTIDATRFGRLPGFFNTKPEYRAFRPQVRVLRANWTLRYPLDVFERFALPEKTHAARGVAAVPEGARGVLPTWVRDILRAPPTERGSRNDTLFAVALQIRDARYSEGECLSMVGGWEQPGFSAEEIRRTVRSVYEEAPRRALASRQVTRAMMREAIDRKDEQ